MSQAERTIPLDSALQARLRRLLWTLRSVVVVEAVGVIVGFWALSFAALVTIDFPLRLSVAARTALLIPVLAGLALLIARRLLPPLRVPMNVADAAHLVEQRRPELASLLVSAVRFGTGQIGAPESNSPQLAGEVVRRANEAAAQWTVGKHVRSRRAYISISVIAVVVACLSIWAGVCGSTLGLALRRTMLLSTQEWPKRTRLVLELEGDRIAAARGDDLEIRARVEGVMPRSVDVVFTPADGESGRQTMTTVGEAGLRYTFLNLDRGMTLHLEGGDDRTREVQVVLSERPRVAGSSVLAVPPSYTGLAPQALPPDQRLIKVLPGSRVEIEFQTSKPIVRADVLAGEAGAGNAEGAGDRWRFSVVPAETTTYFLVLTDAEGLSNRRPERFTIRHVKDEPPTVRLALPGAGDMITPDAVLRIELNATDELGLAEAAVQVAGAAATTRPVAMPLSGFEPGMKEFRTALEWPVSGMAAAAGETLTMSARGSDFNDVSGPGVTQSSPITLRVVTPEELAADFARREQEYRAEFQRLVDQQEDVRRQLLTAADKMDERTPPGERSALLAPLERRQRSLANAVGLLSQQFQRIVDEMRINRMDALGVGDRILQGIADPLTSLSTVDMPDAAELLKRAAREDVGDWEARADAVQARLLEQMRAILARMRETEGYHEAVTMLQDIIQLQKELNAETKKKVESEGADIFDD
ncbi:MAG: hypothetical protein IT449_16675 [Phycisphaerales bacterium]|nr:hypothetical protein [Phycisphaerales bacterium]